MLGPGPGDSVWLGTDHNGVWRFDGTKFVEIRRSQQEEYLPINGAFGFCHALDNSLCFGSMSGLVRYDGATWTTLTTRDGLPTERDAFVAQAPDGSFWIGTANGLVRYRPHTHTLRAPTLRIHADREYQDGAALPPFTEGQRLTFEYGVVDLEHQPDRRWFRRQVLEGARSPETLKTSRSWAAQTHATSFDWTAPAAGKYTFAVQYVDPDLNYSPVTLAHLTVDPPWYRDVRFAGPAYGALAILVGVSAGSTARYMRKRREAERLRAELLEEEHRGRAAAETAARVLEEKNTELEHARHEADSASQAKSQFLASMSHELRTPLNAIIGYAEMLQEEAPDVGAEHLLPDLEKIHSAAKHQLGLINDILDLSKVEAGKMSLFLEEFSVKSLVDLVAETVRPLVAKNDNQLVVQCGSDLGQMRSDQTKVRQVLFNLLSNAAKFTHRGTVSLGVERLPDPAGRVIFRVEDTGIGMSPDQLGRLFQPFTQADGSTSRKYGGTGLGLALSRKFCQLLGGDLIVKSELGKGSVFTAQLPIQLSDPALPTSVTSESTVSGAPTPGGGAQVLVIDDDPSVRDLMRRFLGKEGLRVTTASTGEEGLALARRLQPDVITLDVLMPGVDGWTVLSQIKNDPALASIPVVLVTITDDQNMGFTLGASEYLTKPIDWGRLSAVLQRQIKAPPHRPSAWTSAS
jgi:signal transduction histidine kinase/ActR/RegA family two-component response regulator